MASRLISAVAVRSCYGPIGRSVTPSKILSKIAAEMVSAQLDLDKTGDRDTADYYTGVLDALMMVSNWIAPIKSAKQAQFDAMFDLIRAPAENAA